jgi:site-specific DNA recombinase
MNQKKKVDAALLYVRVSSKRQEDDGDGTGSQEHLCRRHAAQLGVPVEKVFYDSRSGFHDFVTRPGIVGALKHIKANRSKSYIVIFDDLKRLARRTRYYWELRDTFDEYGAVVASPNFKFDNTPHGRHHETITVSHGELEREENRLQVIQKMTARVERGYFVTRAPIGYRYIKVKGEGARLIPDETFAPIVREALEGFASRRFEIQAEVQRFLQDHPEWPRDKTGTRAGQVNINRVKEMLLRPIYAGIISAPHWGVAPCKGLHEPLISIETHQKILARIDGDKRVPARRDLNQDFPLRGFVQCTCCVPLTAGWSKGRSSEYPYYLCYNRSCELYGKSIRRDKIEGEFEVLLKALEPAENLFRVAVGMFKLGWERRQTESAERVNALRSKLQDTERQIGLLLDRIVDAKSQTVFEAMEQRIDLLSLEKLALAEKIANSGHPPRSFDDSLRTALTFLANPWKLWASGRLDQQRAVLKLAFSGLLQYDRNLGFRTAELASPFSVLADSSGLKKWMVGDAGIEPATPSV